MSYALDTLPRAEDWRTRAACADERYAPIRDFWFADDSNRAEARTATTICGHCTARDACLAAAVMEEAGRGQQSMFGIRGGLTSKQRWNRKKRNAARAARAARARKQSDPCGTTAAYYQHLMADEPVDEACQAASDTYEQQLTPPPGPPACGTRGGYQKHVREHTTICTPCRQANADADRRLRNTGTTKAPA